MRSDLELRHLRVFVAVVEVGTHTGAARALSIAQSTVSETLVALERTLGSAVFRRGTKGPMLTASGEALLPYARRVLAMASELVAEVSKVSTKIGATFAVAAVESVCTYVLPTRLAPLRERWPRLRLEVITGACEDIRAGVAAGKIDLGLVLETAAAAGDDEAILTEARLVVFGAPTHALVRKTASAAQLRRCDFYMGDAAGDYHEALRQHFEAAQTPIPRIQALGTIEGVKRGVMASETGLGLLPAHAIAQELRDGLLAEGGRAPR